MLSLSKLLLLTCTPEGAEPPNNRDWDLCRCPSAPPGPETAYSSAPIPCILFGDRSHYAPSHQASARSSVLMHATMIRKPLIFWHRFFKQKNELFQVDHGLRNNPTFPKRYRLYLIAKKLSISVAKHMFSDSPVFILIFFLQKADFMCGKYCRIDILCGNCE